MVVTDQHIKNVHLLRIWLFVKKNCCTKIRNICGLMCAYKVLLKRYLHISEYKHGIFSQIFIENFTKYIVNTNNTLQDSKTTEQFTPLKH